MKHLLLIVIACVAGTAAAANSPNFTGEWKLDTDKSDYATIPTPDKLIRKITHEGTALSYVDQQTGGYGGDQTSTRTVTIDGQMHTIQAKGAEAENTASWEGTALVSDTKVKAAGMTFNDKWVLSDDGKVLTSTVEITSPRGDIELIMVFNRQ
jgi:hypothetical protein